MTEQLSLYDSFASKGLLPSLAPQTGLVTPSSEIVSYGDSEPGSLVIPVLKCLQPQAPEVARGQYPDAKAGMLFLTSTKESFAAPAHVLVLQHHCSRALFPNPNNPKTKNLKMCLAPDALKGTEYGYCSECEYANDWGENREPPSCTESHNFVLLTPSGPALIRFNRTSFKAGKEFESGCRFSVPRKNFWHHPAVVTTTMKTKRLPNGTETTYYEMAINWDRTVVTPEPMQQLARLIFDEIKAAFESGKLGSDELDDDRPQTKVKPKPTADEFEDKIPF